MLFENNEYLDLLFNPVDNYKYESQDDITEGFYKGNMFKNEYKAYKNYTYIKPIVKNKQEELMLEIMKYTFAINDYNLFLDLHPDNKDMLNKYKMCVMNLDKVTKEYEKNYGPLNLLNSDYNTFKWVESPWPWDREDGMYV